MGSWVTYGIGSESADLPGFVVLQSGPRGPRGGAVNWGSGFLPSAYQGVPLRGGGEPILNLSTPRGHLARPPAPDHRGGRRARIRPGSTSPPTPRSPPGSPPTRWPSGCRSSAPELIDLGSETAETLKMYGAEPGKPSFANNCLLARRLVERGVRFVQLYHTDWDHHGVPGQTLTRDLDQVCRDIDQPCAALIKDLKTRGLLDDTLVVWGGEFGRTPMGEIRETVGRNHHIDAMTMWLAGGGVKPGVTVGETDEFGFAPVADRVHIHDLQATILHLLGLDHTKLTFRFQGRDFRLTDVGGKLSPSCWHDSVSSAAQPRRWVAPLRRFGPLKRCPVPVRSFPGQWVPSPAPSLRPTASRQDVTRHHLRWSYPGRGRHTMRARGAGP